MPWLQSRSTGYKNLEALAAKHPTRVRLVYRVLEANGQSILPPAALEAAAEGKFFEFMDAVNAERSDRQLTKARVIELGTKVGIDEKRLGDVIAKHDPTLDYNAKRLVRFHRNSPDALFNGVPPLHQLGSLYMQDLENEYARAYDRAMDLIDRGADASTLAEAFDQEALEGVVPDVTSTGPTDENIDYAPADPPLASPPLDLHGLPAFGPAAAAVPIVVACMPLSANCSTTLTQAKDIQRLYPDSVRIVWAPWYDVSKDESGELGLLSDAALCAEVVGTGADSSEDEPSTSGWRWVEGVLADMRERKGRRASAIDVIDRVARKLRVDARAFASCRATAAGQAVERISAESHSGISASPTLVVGGRIYAGGVAQRTTLQSLVEAELAPGVLGEYVAPSWRRD